MLLQVLLSPLCRENLMKNKIIGLILTMVVLAVYPTWRYFNHANVFAKALINHASPLGKWSYGSVSSSFSGKVTVRNLKFVPSGYKQGFDIENITITTEPMFLLKTSADKLDYMLPQTLTLSVNGAQMTRNSNDIDEVLRNESMWMLMAGFAGSFGCDRDSFTSFNEKDWQGVIAPDQMFNMDLYYSRQIDGTLDVDLILDAENLFSTTWSSNLRSSYNEEQISINELLVDKLFYYYLDNGFNQKRNDICKQNYESSFAAYRLSSAQHVQNYLRSYYSKELPDVLINMYQRQLVPDVEFSASISLDEMSYLSEIVNKNQISFYENASVEIAGNDQKYIPITFKGIDYTKIDSDILKKENLKRQQREEDERLAKEKIKKNKYTKVLHRIGGKKAEKLSISKLSQVIGKKLRIKTHRGRPISGYLISINNGTISIETKYKTGNAKIIVDIEEITSIEMMK